MKSRLTLSLSASQLVLESLGPPMSGRVHGLFRSLPFVGATRSSDRGHATAPIAVFAGIHGDDLRPVFDQAMGELAARRGSPIGRLDVEVQLGLDHARIGVMALEDVAATTLSSDTLGTYAQVWARQMLHVAPETQVIRWQVLENPRKMLISCVDRGIFDKLNDCLARHRLRFVSCRPAALSAASAPGHVLANEGPTEPRGLTVVWTESGTEGRRSACVQLFRFEGLSLSSAWRAWVPAPPEPGCSDDALDGAVRRFLAHTLAGAGDALKRVHWPTGMQATRLGP